MYDHFWRERTRENSTPPSTVLSRYKEKSIESVQSNFTRKLLMRCVGLGYQYIPNGEERRKQLGLPSLRITSPRNNLFMGPKVIKGSTEFTLVIFLTPPSGIRGANAKLKVPAARSLARHKSFPI